MATLEVIALDTVVPQLRAPKAGDSYNMPRPLLLGTTVDDGVNQGQVLGSFKIFGPYSFKGSYGPGGITSNFVAGDGALASNVTGTNNTAIGNNSLPANTSGNYNTAYGNNAGSNVTTGSGNTLIGANSVTATPGANNNVVISTGDGVTRALFNGIYWSLSAPLRFNGFTVATLPAGVQGMRAFVTDALAPAYLTTLAGGGTTVAPAFYNGTAWISA